MHYATATQQLAALKSGQITATALLAQCRQRIEAVNPSINAVVAFCWDAATARAAALDARAAAGDWAGPLHGLPMTVKEGFNVTGLPTTVGDPRLKNNIAKQHAVAVQRLEDAGAIVFGKTNVPLFMADLQSYNAVYGTSKNPWNVAHTPGGSSGGAAAALAAGLTPLELGSDLAGSIRTPAHFCGVYGHRPTFGLVPTHGHFVGKRTHSDVDFTVAGPMARSAEDLALAMQVLAGPQNAAGRRWPITLPASTVQQLAGTHVGVWLDDSTAPIDSAMAASFEQAIAKLAAAGCIIVRGTPPGMALAELYPLYFKLMGAAIGGGLPEKFYSQARKGALLAKLLRKGGTDSLLAYAKTMTISHHDWCELNETAARLKAKVNRYFKEVDVLLTPVTPSPAPPLVEPRSNFYKRTIQVSGKPRNYAEQMVWAGPAAVLGLPATAMPVGLSAGLPVGLQVVGPELGDLTSIGFAQLAAEVLGGFVAPTGW